jgi:hypothetical protein
MIRTINLNLNAADAIGTGVTKANAALLAAELNLCVTTDGNVAFILPPCNMGMEVVVFCSDQLPAIVFGDGNDDFIMGGQFAETVTIPPQSAVRFLSLESQWMVFPSA